MQNHTRKEMNKAPAVSNVTTCQRHDVVFKTPLPPSCRDVGMLRHWECLTQMSFQVTSSHVKSLHVTSCHVTSHYVTSQYRNFVTLQRRDVLGSDKQRRNIVHQCRDVAGFSSDGKVAKIQSLGLLPTSKLFIFHSNHPRSSHDHINKEQHWI